MHQRLSALLFSLVFSVPIVNACAVEARERTPVEERYEVREEEGRFEMPSDCRNSEVREYEAELREEERRLEEEEQELQEQQEAEEEEALSSALEEVSVDSINENHPEVVEFWHGLTDEEVESFGRTYLGYRARNDGTWHFHPEPIAIEMAQIYYGACIDIENAVTIVELGGPFTADNYIDVQYVYCHDNTDTFDTMMELKENMEDDGS